MSNPLRIKSAGNSKTSINTAWIKFLQVIFEIVFFFIQIKLWRLLVQQGELKLLSGSSDYLPDSSAVTNNISGSARWSYRIISLAFVSRSSSSFLPLNLSFLTTTPITFPSKLQHCNWIWCLAMQLGKKTDYKKNCSQPFLNQLLNWNILYMVAVTTV